MRSCCSIIGYGTLLWGFYLLYHDIKERMEKYAGTGATTEPPFDDYTNSTTTTESP